MYNFAPDRCTSLWLPFLHLFWCKSGPVLVRPLPNRAQFSPIRHDLVRKRHTEQYAFNSKILLILLGEIGGAGRDRTDA